MARIINDDNPLPARAQTSLKSAAKKKKKINKIEVTQKSTQVVKQKVQSVKGRQQRVEYTYKWIYTYVYVYVDVRIYVKGSS